MACPKNIAPTDKSRYYGYDFQTNAYTWIEINEPKRIFEFYKINLNIVNSPAKLMIVDQIESLLES